MKSVPKQNPPASIWNILEGRIGPPCTAHPCAFQRPPTAWNTGHGRDLILLDTHANLIVDFIPEAVPTARCDDDASNVSVLLFLAPLSASTCVYAADGGG